MNTLNRTVLNESDRHAYDAVLGSPVIVLQIGEGNFLRGFFDWMIHECRKQGLFHGSVAVTQPRPSGKPKIDALARQDGLYTLVIRGLENGRKVEKQEIMTVFSRVFDPYSDWDAFIRIAVSLDLRFVVSNTTEAGLAYSPEIVEEGKPIRSFPGKIAYLLYRRYLAFEGAVDKGLIFLPCELLERNGDELKKCVIRHCNDWNLPVAFIQWVENNNRFLNSLVDRIVTGYPAGQAEQWFAQWGYRDDMLNTAEPYHFWAIEAEPEMDGILPLKQAGLNVVWTNDLKPFQLRKVRILNGAHTLMTPLGILYGFEHVRNVMNDKEFGTFVRNTVLDDIVPTLPMSIEELRGYASSVFERFGNPFIFHRLSDIAMNSISKFKVRLLPVLSHYAEIGMPCPERLVTAFCGLLRYYKIKRNGNDYEGVAFDGTPYRVRDDGGVLEAFEAVWAKVGGRPSREKVERLLALPVWGTDLLAWDGFIEAVTGKMSKMERGLRKGEVIS